MRLAEFSVRQAIIATGLDAFTVAAAVDDGTLPSVQRGSYFYVHRDNLAAFAAAHDCSIDDSRIQVSEFANQLASQPASTKSALPAKPIASGLIDLAKARAAAAGKPFVERSGNSFADFVRHRLATEAARKPKA